MKKSILIFVLLMFCLLGADTFSVQGVLRDPLGKTVEDGYYSLNFKLYNAETGGIALWEETHEMVLIGNGVYLVELGSVTSLDAVAFNENYWIGIGVNGGAEMEPRIKMTKSPSAMSVFGVDNVFPSTGQVGVGTHEPEAYLHIVDSTSGLDKLRIEGEDGANDVVVSAAGKMGVNVEEPAASLHIESIDSETDKLLIKNEDGSTNMVVTSDGKIGVNTEIPAEALDITGNMKMRNGSILFSDGSTLNSADFGGSASSITNYGTAFITADSDDNGSGNIEFKSGLTTVMYITPDDKIFVGDWEAWLDVESDIEIRNRSVMIWDGVTNYDIFTPEIEPNDLIVQGNIKTNEQLIIYSDQNGADGIQFYDRDGGYSAYDYAIDRQSHYLGFYYKYTTDENFNSISWITSTGTYYIPARNDRANTESYRGALQKVAEIEPLRYNIEGEIDFAKKHIGFASESVAELFPELVIESEDGIGINTSGYGVVAISAVKELNEKVEEQEQKIEELEKALAALMQEVKNLKN